MKSYLRMSKFVSMLLFAFVVAVCHVNASGDIAYTSSGGDFDTNSGFTLGFVFSPNSDIIVNALGVFDLGSDGPGLETDHEVGLWRESDETLLALTTVPGGTAGTLISDFRFQSISPVMLIADTDYIVAAYFPTLGDKVVRSTPTASPEIDIEENTRFSSGSSLRFPSAKDNMFLWRSTANFTFTPIPEPNAMTIFMLAGLGLVRRKR